MLEILHRTHHACTDERSTNRILTPFGIDFPLGEGCTTAGHFPSAGLARLGSSAGGGMTTGLLGATGGIPATALDIGDAFVGGALRARGAAAEPATGFRSTSMTGPALGGTIGATSSGNTRLTSSSPCPTMV